MDPTAGHQPIRTVVVGTGQIGAVHVECARRAGAQVVGVLGSTPQRAKAKAQAWDVPRVFTDLAEVVAADDVDVVHIASPNHLHTPQVLEVVRGGKHVVCEKPLALNGDDARAMVDAATSAGVVNATCFNFRFYPMMHEAHALIAQGDIGEPRFLTGSYHQDWLFHDTDWNWRLDPGRAGELRAVADIGSHWIDLLMWISQRPVLEVFADLHTFVPTRFQPDAEIETFSGATADGTPVTVDSDDAATVLLRFADGTRGSFTVSQVSAGRKNDLRFELAGSKAALMWSSERSDSLWIGHRGRTNEIFLKDPVHLSPQAAAVAFYPGGHVEGYAEAFTALFRAIYADVRAGGPSPNPAYPTFLDGYRGACIADAIAASAQSGTWVSVPGAEGPA